MYSIIVEIVFHADHYIRIPGGKEEKRHAHDWTFRSKVSAEELDEYGLVMDFHLLRRLMQEVSRPLEAVETINELAAFAGSYPTAETIGRYLYQQMKAVLPGRVRLLEVMLEEEAGCYAVYSE